MNARDKKKKDDLNGRKVIGIYCNRKELELIVTGDKALKKKQHIH